ncbi:MAG: UDP-N-acetylmuramoyl-L-alanyl-D-glutamate--2,6-diaminopimelate ligase [Ignavibacteriales bacterium]|nr:UDP-N-acetylmuramoyl-L-alanyl-D-glutamate--2,6-diaminopimelate ligase [Ignavibacteriales bacterium]
MELTKLINSVRSLSVSGEVERKDISSITSDSRKVKSGCLFVAIKGFAYDGHRFIMDAISKGAIAIILEDDKALPHEMFIHANVTKIVVRDSRKALAAVSHYFYKEPTKKLQLVGITGTNGKTTTAWLVKFLLEKLGHKSGLLGTIANYIGGRKLEAQLTTPESSELNELFHEMVLEGCSHAVMEVSSHALALDRVDGLTFHTAVFSNLTQDHLDFHGDFAAYFAEKKKLFDGLDAAAFAIPNFDDPYGREIVKDCKAKIFSYGSTADCAFRIANIKFDLLGTRFNLSCNGAEVSIATNLIGKFNAYNLTSALAVLVSFGYSLNELLPYVSELPQVPGRFEVLSHENKIAIIDYSHTPDSLEKTLENIRCIVGNSRPVITVFGCGGNRDKTKRPLMGAIAARLSDLAYVTSDNPRQEVPSEIIKDIVAGISSTNFVVEELREKAITNAIAQSADNAVILVAGKGHEDYQVIGTEKRHFSDREVALAAMREKA